VSEERSGDAGGREFSRVLGELRNRLADGQYPLQTLLPPQRELADAFDVSRDTVQRVLKALEREGWIKSRQGSGSRVVREAQRVQAAVVESAKPSRTTLGPIIADAFRRPEVTLDVYTLTSESLDTHIRLRAEWIRENPGSAPRSIAVRMLVPSDTTELSYPVSKSDPADPRPVERVRNITRKSVASVEYVLKSLKIEKLVPDVHLEIRHALVVPTFKLYLLNKTEALFGTYKFVERPIILDSGEEIDAIDVVGVGADLTYYVREGDEDSPAAFFVESMQDWFDSVWKYRSE